MSLDTQSVDAAQLSPLEAVRAHLRAGFKIFSVFGLRFENGKLLCACGNPSSNAKPVSQEKTRPQLAFSVKDFAAALGVSPSLVSNEFKLARIRSFRLRRRLLIPRSEGERLAGNAAQD